MNISYKSFLLGLGEDYDGGQDAVAINPAANLYSVADGVTKSYHPEFLARRLCDAFIASNWSELEMYKGGDINSLFFEVPDKWKRDVLSHRSSLQGLALEQDIILCNRYNHGASTLCGIYIDKEKETLKYVVVGDSTLFVNYFDGKIRMYNTCPKEEDDKGVLRTLFSNKTSAILSDNTISGTCETGELTLDNVSSVALMTDGMAQWFQNKIIQGYSPFEYLWGIADMKKFEEFVEMESEDGDLDDDLAVILIKFSKKVHAETNLEYEKICRKVFGIEP